METKDMLDELISRIYEEIENYPAISSMEKQKEIIRLYFSLLDYKERYY